MSELDPFESGTQDELNELSEAVRDEDAEIGRVELSPLHENINEIAVRVADRACVGVIVLDATNLGAWERQYGAAQFTQLMSKLAEATERMKGSAIRTDDIVCVDATGGETVLIFLGAPREDHDGPTIDFENIVARVKRQLYEPFHSTQLWYHTALEMVCTGSALLIRNDSVDPRREIYRAIRQARIDAQVGHREIQRQRHRVVGHMIAQRKIRTLYQPIVELATRDPIGFEALSRAEQSDAEKLGVHLFVAAAKADLDGELDQTCRSLSIVRRPGLATTRRLFVNCLPGTFYEPMRELELMLEEWEGDGLAAEQLVFEITENITHEQLRRILPNVQRLQARGYQFAVDDVGTGTSNLQLIADLEPQFIKMDISLTRGISVSTRKQELATYLLDLAERCNAELIAEGIESQADCDTVMRLGIRLGQGYLLGMPASAEHAVVL